VLLKDTPVYFEEVKPLMQELETDRFCDTVFPNNTDMLGKCRTTLDGFLLKGASNTMYFALNELTRTNFNFVTNRNNKTVDYLKMLLSDKKMTMIMDVANFILEPAFD
jgi:hypothetical protein